MNRFEMPGVHIKLFFRHQEDTWSFLTVQMRENGFSNISSNMWPPTSVSTKLFFNMHLKIILDPYETVTFFVGGYVDRESQIWKWNSGDDVGDETEKCEMDHYSGDCLGITWNQQLGCK